MNLRQQDWSRLKPGAENSAWFSAMSGTHLVELSLPRYRPAGSWNQEQTGHEPRHCNMRCHWPQWWCLGWEAKHLLQHTVKFVWCTLRFVSTFFILPRKNLCKMCFFFFSFKLCYLLERERMCPSCGSLPQMLQLPWSWELGTHVGSRNPVTWTITADSLSLQ